MWHLNKGLLKDRKFKNRNDIYLQLITSIINLINIKLSITIIEVMFLQNIILLTWFIHFKKYEAIMSTKDFQNQSKKNNYFFNTNTYELNCYQKNILPMPIYNYVFTTLWNGRLYGN